MKIVFSSQAKTDLAEIVKFIAYNKPQAARQWSANIHQLVLKLADFPKTGRTVPEFSNETIRELIKGQYRVVYKIDGEKDTIVIITIHHGMRLLV